MCVCVCLSVKFVHFVKINKHIFKLFPPSVFPYQTSWQYSDGNYPNRGVERRSGRLKSRF